jgi:ABC-type nitrate/sulfonate/bicarbonate transport system substrate-binding protein
MSISTKRLHRLAGAAAAILLAATAAPAAEAPAPTDLEVSTIRYLSSSGSDVNPVELADALGYLAPLKLERLGDSQGGPASLQALATGQTDIASAFNGAIINIVAAGAPLTSVVSWRGTNEQTSPGLYVLQNSGIKSARDLIGKSIGVNTLGANQEAVSNIFLSKGGLSREEIKQVTYVPLPTPNLEQALRNGQVAAVSLGFSFRDAALARGGIEPLVRNVDLLGTYSDNTGVLSNAFIEKNPKTTRHLVAGIAKAIAWAQAREKESKREEVIDLYRQYLTDTGRGDGLAPLDYWQSLGIATDGGWIRHEEFAMWIDWLDSRGEVDAKSLDLKKFYTNAFNPFWDGQS